MAEKPKDDEVKYRVIFKQLRGEILDGKYDSSTRFPSEMMLVRRFGASRSTVIRTMIELQKCGLVERRRGSGTFVSGMVRATTGSLGMIIPGQRDVEIFAPICAEIARRSRENGYVTLIGDVSSPDPMTRVRQALMLASEYARQRVSGVFVEPIEMLPDSGSFSREICGILTERGIPLVLLDRDITPPHNRSAYDLVGIDNVRAGEMLARHLIECGARDIRFFMRPDSSPPIQRRCKGVASAVVEAGLKWGPGSILSAAPGDVEAVRRFIVGRRLPDAVVCGNDRTAAMLLQTLEQLDLHVPKNLMLAGFDDVKCAQLLSPPLTSMRQPCEDIARVAVETLLHRISSPDAPVREIALEAELVPRRSTLGWKPPRKS